MIRTTGFINIFRRATAMLVCMAIVFLALPYTLIKAEEEYDLPWLWPVPGSYKINSLDSYYNGGIHNSGQCIDIAANGYTGSERLDVISATSGEVLYIQNKYSETGDRGAGWGNYVIVQSGNVNIVYAHLQSVSCTYGRIEAGDLIGKMGNTGNSTAVHLHLQAYLTGGKIESCDVMAFEQYRLNPLYYEKFQFLKGLETYSAKYGQWIKDYYSKASGSYYGYSGGLNSGVDFDPVSAYVTVINTSGADTRSLPVSDNSFITDTYPHGQRIRIMGCYGDSYGKLWLAVYSENGVSGWISASDVGFYDYLYSLTSKDFVYPKGEHGGFSELRCDGELISDNLIASYKATIMSGDKVFASYTQSVKKKSFSLEGVMAGFGIDIIPDGEYTFILQATEKAEYPGADAVTKEYEIITSPFSVDAKSADSTPPILENLSINELTDRKVNISCHSSDNKSLYEVVAVLYDASGNKINEYELAGVDGVYTLDLTPNSIGGAGNGYRIVITAYDYASNSASAERSFTVPKGGKNESWNITSSIKVRSGPGLSYKHVDGIPAGSILTTTEIVVADGYIWAKHSGGYSPLGTANLKTMYGNYRNGHLYSVNFDLNGGSGETPAAIDKHYAQTITLPESVPTRVGYTFLGWSSSSGASSAEYKAGAAYSENKTVTLFAVWADLEKPVISTVVTSEKNWTNAGVGVTVSATDNTGTVFYSFDGGSSWQNGPTAIFYENTIITPNQIAVRDPSGNITYYTGQINIENIDTDAPDTVGHDLQISVNGSTLIVNFSGITDLHSGISHHQIVYSHNKDMSDPESLTITAGQSITLTQGVYYWILRSYDKAGNCSEIVGNRFRIGSAERLTAPTGLSALGIESDSATLSWTPVLNADRYIVTLSGSPDFSEVKTFECTENKCEVGDLSIDSTYYFKVVASSEDGIYLTSASSDAESFTTLNGNSKLFGFNSLYDAKIDHDELTVDYLAHYSTLSLDISAKADERSEIEYFSDSYLITTINDPENYTFTDDYAELYIRITAESGASSVYEVRVNRAERSASSPEVSFFPRDEEIYVGDEVTPIGISASVEDGGVISIVWYMSYNGGEAVEIGDGNRVAPICAKAGSYSVYAVVTNTNAKCEQTTAVITTENLVITVSKYSTEIVALCDSFVYNGTFATPSYAGYIGSALVSYSFYSDPECQTLINTPMNAGVYYVVAQADENDKYFGAKSEPVRFEIYKSDNRSQPELSVIQPSFNDTNGYVTVSEAGVEYRLEGSSLWVSAAIGEISFAENTTVYFRFAESANYKASESKVVQILQYDGARDLVPKSDSPLKVSGGYLISNAHSVKASDLLAYLENSTYVNIYSVGGQKMNLSDELVMTGARIVIEDEGQVYTTLTIIILGDIDCDGAVSRSDAYGIMEFSNVTRLPEGRYDLVASDLDCDGEVSSLDAYLAMLKATAE